MREWCNGSHRRLKISRLYGVPVRVRSLVPKSHIYNTAEYGRGLSAWSHKPRNAGSNPASATNMRD